MFSVCETIYPRPEEMATLQQRLGAMPALGSGELETRTICQTRGWFYAAIDQQALAYARSLGVTMFALRVILRRSHPGRILRPGGELMRCRIDANATVSGVTCYENRLNRLPSSRVLCWRIDPPAAMLTSAHRGARPRVRLVDTVFRRR
jgi:hypothetical protein